MVAAVTHDLPLAAYIVIPIFLGLGGLVLYWVLSGKGP